MFIGVCENRGQFAADGGAGYIDAGKHSQLTATHSH